MPVQLVAGRGSRPGHHCRRRQPDEARHRESGEKAERSVDVTAAYEAAPPEMRASTGPVSSGCTASGATAPSEPTEATECRAARGSRLGDDKGRGRNGADAVRRAGRSYALTDLERTGRYLFGL